MIFAQCNFAEDAVEGIPQAGAQAQQNSGCRQGGGTAEKAGRENASDKGSGQRYDFPPGQLFMEKHGAQNQNHAGCRIQENCGR